MKKRKGQHLAASKKYGYLPKQWEHWCRENGLKPSSASIGRSYVWYYLQGRGRMWRVNCFNEFQCGDRIEDFDRWSTCYIYGAEMPKTLNEFSTAVDYLLDLHALDAL